MYLLSIFWILFFSFRRQLLSWLFFYYWPKQLKRKKVCSWLTVQGLLHYDSKVWQDRASYCNPTVRIRRRGRFMPDTLLQFLQFRIPSHATIQLLLVPNEESNFIIISLIKSILHSISETDINLHNPSSLWVDSRIFQVDN